MRANLLLLGIAVVVLGTATSVPAGEVTPGDPGPRILLPPTNGTFLFGLLGHQEDIGLPPDGDDGAVRLTNQSWALKATGCHTHIFADLHFRPTSLSGDPETPIDVPYVFDVRLTFNNTTVSHRLFEPREHITLARLPEAGNLSVDLVLRQGIAVTWTITVYAHESLDCGGPIPVEDMDRTAPWWIRPVGTIRSD